MKPLIVIIFTIFLFACNSQPKKETIKVVTDISKQDTILNEVYEVPYFNFDTTIVIHNKSFVITTKIYNDYLESISVNSIFLDTLYRDGINSIEFTDFNKDSYYDILVSYIGNVVINDIYLFDIKENNFKKIDGFQNYPESVQLKSCNTLYYSYHRAGCADMNWVSDLFTIENFKIIHLGHIYGMSCEQDPQVIEINRILNNNDEQQKLIEKLSYVKIISQYDDKWDFIEKYWNLNYKKFTIN